MSEPKEQTTRIIKETPTPDTILDVQQTNCCIVGGGPTGVVLALLLARQGIPVILLEAHKTFERDFRGDLIQAGAMEIMDELGLTDRLLKQVPHSKTGKMEFSIGGQTVTFADFSQLQTRHPYITIIPQVKLIEFLTNEAKRYSNFQLVAGANVQQLIEEDGIIRGVRYRGQGGWHEVRSHLTVAADGRFSPIRKLAGMELIETAAPMDLLWFRLPRHSSESEGLRVRYGSKRVLVTYNTFDGNWQIAAVIPKGSYRQMQAEGIKTLQQSIVEVIPEFSDRVEHLKDWQQTSLLSVQMGRLSQWYRPGLLLLGDAAHVMSPLGGVGITYAIQDAVAAANVLSEPLKRDELQLGHLAAVQRQRELAIKVIQGFQSFTQKRITAKAVQADNSLKLPIYLRLPLLSDIRARLFAFGAFPPHVKVKFSL
ncbi:2-polyprenyl-6-methoxyphenol hydroxylase-like oxidoreductase [Cylindrospermum stagnale PCC 7417]|uniref:2-polyprenyl-6-methoxyphenol hydroxylase-like oxidoreductase n=1 Tax=Cylindrospermum stagnale PCC 7417 TaxID=56107 RepID=K9WPT7_9NOST|nr:FAD-dependent oxidoreductase [Cylindrospermum stagnale]AFZ22405.1 2-polyprenyl-6-methoxyphenol hydroxylase-like oxidoreductase [Cylindrospermum stagnale PCC 7417]